MEFLDVTLRDGLHLVGLISQAADPRGLVLHIHGFGGDFYSNRLVRECHLRYPAGGYTFVSISLRTTGYVTEAYSERSVAYCGASVANHDDVLGDLDEILDSITLEREVQRAILQGHSFGTNCVKRYQRARSGPSELVLLSPADSVALYHLWRRSASPDDDGDGDGASISWNLFGVATQNAVYPIPISRSALDRLLRSEVFREWSADTPPANGPALLLRGSTDPISNYGTTGDDEALRRMVPNATLRDVEGAGHLFSGREAQMCASVLEWLNAS